MQGRRRIWAVVAAFGDNLARAARALASLASRRQRVRLPHCASSVEDLAYNAYGDSVDDLIVASRRRCTARLPATPIRFVCCGTNACSRASMRFVATTWRWRAKSSPQSRSTSATVYVLPDAAWSRRVRGAFGNHLTNRFPDLAHAILTLNAQGGYTVSVRAPQVKPTGADALCREFPTGGGRAAAAGINHLPQERLADFARCMDHAFA